MAEETDHDDNDDQEADDGLEECLEEKGGEDAKTPEWINTEGEETSSPPEDTVDEILQEIKNPKAKAKGKAKAKAKQEPKAKGRKPKEKGPEEQVPEPKAKPKAKNGPKRKKGADDMEAAEKIAAKLRKVAKPGAS